MKSMTFEQTSVAAVSVADVPTAPDCTNRRFVVLFPLRVRVPVIVWLAPKVSVSVLFAVAVRMTLAKVFAPLIVAVPDPVINNINPYAKPAPENMLLLPAIVTVAVPDEVIENPDVVVVNHT